MIITIDGPAGAGKGTISKAIAQRFDLRSVDSGLIYRALAFKVMTHQVPVDNVEMLMNLAQTLVIDDLSNPQLRHESTGAVASRIAIHPPVRDMLNSILHRIVNDTAPPYKGVVIDGRDIGTKVFPHAHIKFFITANPHARANRRAFEMQQKARSSSITSIAQTYEQIMERDNRDQTRHEAPLMAAQDAYVLDTSDLSIQESCDLAINHILQKQEMLNESLMVS